MLNGVLLGVLEQWWRLKILLHVLWCLFSFLVIIRRRCIRCCQHIVNIVLAAFDIYVVEDNLDTYLGLGVKVSLVLHLFSSFSIL